LKILQILGLRPRISKVFLHHYLEHSELFTILVTKYHSKDFLLLASKL
jgi:hypothetical protein